MLSLKHHIYRAGPYAKDGLAEKDLEATDVLRKHIEPWLTAVFQSEHLSLLIGSGFSNAVAITAGGKTVSMSTCDFGCALADKVDEHAKASAERCGRGTPNIEDQIQAANHLILGLRILGDERASEWTGVLDRELTRFLYSILESERSIKESADKEQAQKAESLLVSFLMSFASRAATRERLNLFTTNYDRLVEHGCDRAGLHVIDRFVGSLSPVFRVSRLSLDIHYNPPGIRGEPRYLEGVIRFSKLHGSLDWRWEDGEVRRYGVPFGAPSDHPEIPKKPSESVMIYPNPAKDVETVDYPYAELFRDFAASICRPNSSVVTYGYGFGDEHINRILQHMLTIPSTHLVIVAWDKTAPENTHDPGNATRQRIINFCNRAGRDSQISLLLGSHFGDLATLVDNYLPKPAIDQITIRKTRLEEQRGEEYRKRAEGADDEHAD